MLSRVAGVGLLGERGGGEAPNSEAAPAWRQRAGRGVGYVEVAGHEYGVVFAICYER